MRHSPAPLQIGQAPGRVGDGVAEVVEFAHKGRAGLLRRLPVSLQVRQGLRGVPGEVVAPGAQRLDGALFEVADFHPQGAEPTALRVVLRQSQGEGPAAALQRVGSFPNLLVENGQGVAIREILAGGGKKPADNGGDGLEHGGTFLYEHRSQTHHPTSLNAVQAKY